MIWEIAGASAIVLLSSATFGQSLTTPAIEVATVKLNKSSNSVGNHFDPERMSWTGVPLSVLIQSAYGVQAYQTSGGPNWLNSYRWDIDAKTEGPTSTTQKFQLLQPLLAERFQLRFHRETRKMTEYKLVVAKNGAKLHEVKAGEPVSAPAGTRIGRGLIEGHRVAISDLVGFLRGELGQPVLEGTGLKGRYDFKLEWVPDESQPNSGGNAPPPDAEGPSIFSAVQEQLGLKLEALKGPVEILVIDHVERPSGN